MIETDLGEALTNAKTLAEHLPLMSAGVLKEPALEATYTEIE